MPCAHCKQTGHNKRTCPFISKEMVAEELDIVDEEMIRREKSLFLPSELEDGENEEESEESEDESDVSEFSDDDDDEIDIELVRKELELYRKNGYDDEGKRAAVLPESFFGPKKKKVAPKKKKKKAKKKAAEVKGMKGAVELIMKQQKKAKKRKVVDIDTTGLKVERSIAELLARSGRMIDPEYIKEVGFGDDE